MSRPVTEQPDPRLPEDPAVELMAAEAYASDHGVSLDEAVAAIRFQSAVKVVDDEVERLLGETCGELWFGRSGRLVIDQEPTAETVSAQVASAHDCRVTLATGG